MPANFHCYPPCEKSFATTKALNAHISNKPDCYKRYSDFLESLVQLHASRTTSNGPSLPNAPEEFDEVSSIAPPLSPLSEIERALTLLEFPGDNEESNFESDQAPPNNAVLDDLNNSSELGLEPSEDMPTPPLQGPGMLEINAEDESKLYVEMYPDAGRVLRRKRPIYERLEEEIVTLGEGNRYYPFSSETEWGLASFLHNSLTIAQTDTFLKLKFMQQRLPSFRSGAALRDRMEQLPNTAPRWMAQDIVPNYGTPLDSVTLFYRNPIEAITFLLGRPSLAADMEFAPKKVWIDDTKETRVYSSISSGNWWWRTQASSVCFSSDDRLHCYQGSLDAGATVIPVLLSSDKTRLSNFAGDKSAWPLYMSIGNIAGKVRNSPSKQAWVIIAYLPVVKFHENKNKGVLADRLFHQCVETVLSPLISAGNEGILLADSYGDVRHSYPFLAGYIADYPEQLLINAAAGNNSPVTTASYHDLGSSTSLPPRTYNWIMTQIAEVSNQVDPADIAKYAALAREYGLNGVHHPFWRDLPKYQPEIAICPDLLHGGHRFFRDHILFWVRSLVGTGELDRRLSALQPTIGYRHFHAGINSLIQWTGREDRELQRVFLAVIAGAPLVTPKVLKNVRALLDFLYLAQYISHSDTTLDYLRDALQKFHTTKDVYITTGVRVGSISRKVIPHFKIPKVAALHAYALHIPEMGSSPQYSSDISEFNHKDMAKDPYRLSNHRDPEWQMVRHLARHDTINCINEFHAWRVERDTSQHTEAFLHSFSPGFRSVAAPLIAAYEREATSSIAALTRKARQSARLWLTVNPQLVRQEVAQIAQTYALPYLHTAMTNYISSYMGESHMSIYREADSTNIHYMDVWHKLRIRLPSVQDEDQNAQARVVEAIPPGNGLEFGRCNCVLVVDDEDEAQSTGISGYRVAQVRLLFALHIKDRSHPIHKKPLAYVEWFSRPKPTAEPHINMYIVSREERPGDMRRGEVIPLDRIHRFVHLVPKFGSVVADQLTADNSMDICRDYWVNSFGDKELFQAVY